MKMVTDVGRGEGFGGEIVRALRGRDVEAWLEGGWVRSLLLPAMDGGMREGGGRLQR
ncbi:MAG: hypothetical protein ACP5E5_02265 [Acidobacteriaceae bacterium]